MVVEILMTDDNDNDHPFWDINWGLYCTTNAPNIKAMQPLLRLLLPTLPRCNMGLSCLTQLSQISWATASLNLWVRKSGTMMCQSSRCCHCCILAAYSHPCLAYPYITSCIQAMSTTTSSPPFSISGNVLLACFFLLDPAFPIKQGVEHIMPGFPAFTIAVPPPFIPIVLIWM